LLAGKFQPLKDLIVALSRVNLRQQTGKLGLQTLALAVFLPGQKRTKLYMRVNFMSIAGLNEM
jgi:hypothetical protein